MHRDGARVPDWERIEEQLTDEDESDRLTDESERPAAEQPTMVADGGEET